MAESRRVRTDSMGEIGRAIAFHLAGVSCRLNAHNVLVDAEDRSG